MIDPRILILDEATSSVDTETEKEIQNALDNLVRGRTTIAIAHRLSTLRRANRLVVMDRGKIVEVGSHEELIARQGAYYRLYEAQARNVDAEELSLAAAWPASTPPQHLQKREEAKSMTTPDFRIERNTFGRLDLSLPGGVMHQDVTPVRASPIAAPDRGISLVAPDGHELVWIDHLTDLPAETRALVEEELASREFVPEIQCLREVSSFATRALGRLTPTAAPPVSCLRLKKISAASARATLLIADIHGIQYLIRDLAALDRQSRRLLDRFL